MENITYIGGLFSDTYHVHFHIHKTYELVYYTQGTGFVKIGDMTEAFSPGTFTIIAPNIPHSDYADEGFQNLHFNMQHPGFPVNGYLKLQDSENRDIYKILAQMHYEYHLKRKNWKALVDSLYNVLYQYLISFLQDELQHPYVEQIIRDIICNLSNPAYSLHDAIAKLPYNPNYFSNLFLEKTGLTPTQYLSVKRIDYAKALISTKSLSGFSYKEIAVLCGYRDPYYFSRQFKLQTGLSPRDWQQKNIGRGIGPAGNIQRYADHL